MSGRRAPEGAEAGTARTVAGLTAVAAFVCLVVGCDQATLPPPIRHPLPAREPLLALQWDLRYMDPIGYASLFTDDFRFQFSAQSDSALTAMYGGNWSRDDENAAAEHLFEGFMDAHGVFHPSPSNLAAEFVNEQVYPDPAHPDSSAEYLFVPVTVANLTADVPGDSGHVIRFVVRAPQDFWLVRGDAARLRAGQPADSTRWYIRGWQELAPASQAAGVASGDTIRTTWGRLKASYR